MIGLNSTSTGYPSDGQGQGSGGAKDEEGNSIIMYESELNLESDREG